MAALSWWQLRHSAGAELAGVCDLWHDVQSPCLAFGGLNSAATFLWQSRQAVCATPGSPWNVWQFLQSAWCGMLGRPRAAASNRFWWHRVHVAPISVISNTCLWWHDVQTWCFGGPAVATALALSPWHLPQMLGGGSGLL